MNLSGAGGERVWVVDPARQVPAYDHHLSTALARAGWEVTLATAPAVHDALPVPAGAGQRIAFGRLLVAAPLERVAGWRPARRLLRLLGYAAEWRSLERELRRVRAPAPVMHAQWALLPPWEATRYRRLRRAGVPVVHTVHNVLPHERWPLAATRWRAVYRAASLLIAHSSATAERVRRQMDGGGRASPRVEVVPMPAEPVTGAPGRVAARMRLDLPASDPLVAFVGHVRPYKGLELLLSAWPHVLDQQPSARLLIAGAVHGGTAAERRLAQLIAERAGGRRIRLRLGYQPDRRLHEAVAAADVVALPYRATDDSAVLALARGHGRAVVATEVGGLPEALAAGGGRLVPPADAEAFAHAVAALLGRPEERQVLEAEQRAAARAWTWDDAARATIAAYGAARAAEARARGGGRRPWAG